MNYRNIPSTVNWEYIPLPKNAWVQFKKFAYTHICDPDTGARELMVAVPSLFYIMPGNVHVWTPMN